MCPSCSAKRAVKFAEHLYDEILADVEHRHIGCSIPKRLRCFFRYDRKLLSILFQAAWWALKDVISEGNPGLVLTVQTFGESLNFNPHLHGILSNSLFLPDGSQKPLPEFNLEALSRSFATRVLTELVEHELISQEVSEQILSQEHTGFNFWLGEPFGDKERKLFVARYILLRQGYGGTS